MDFIDVEGLNKSCNLIAGGVSPCKRLPTTRQPQVSARARCLPTAAPWSVVGPITTAFAVGHGPCYGPARRAAPSWMRKRAAAERPPPGGGGSRASGMLIALSEIPHWQRQQQALVEGGAARRAAAAAASAPARGMTAAPRRQARA